MSDQSLSQKLEALDGGTDFTDPNVYATLLGYNDEPQPDATPAPQGETAAPAPAQAEPAAVESNPAPAVAEPKEGEIAGVLTKDGKHLMPYSVVQNLRQTAQTQAERIAELQAALEKANAEKQAQADGTSTADSQAKADAALLQFTEDELADLEAIPAAAKLVKGVQALQAKLNEVQTIAPAAAPAAPAAAPNRDAIQTTIDSMPLLATWQAKGGELWTQAVQMDNDLQSDPQWAGKPMAERFEEVQRRIATDYGFSVPSTPRGNSAPAPQPRSNPQPEAREVMPTLSDFSGGTAGIGDPMAGATVGQMVDKATKTMSVEELRKWVGLSY